MTAAGRRRVVVTGLGVVSPLGIGMASTWDGMLSGRSGAGELTRFDASEFTTRIAAEATDFDPLDFIDAREARRGSRTIELTTTEFNLLLLFLRHPRKVLTRDVIMEHVWAYDFEGESNVLEVYVRYLRSKLEADGESRLIHTVRGAGYVMKE